MKKLIFLKLGGSLITDKTRAYTPRLEVIKDSIAEIKQALDSDPSLSLVLGHGSGSFGHVAADQYQTHQGVSGKAGWIGFTQVWYQAAALNRLVIDELHRAGIPALGLSPVAAVTAQDGLVRSWDLGPVRAALMNGLLPVIHGDVIFDSARGGTILSTEDLFSYLARDLKPHKILLAGLEAGVWSDFPERKQLLNELTPDQYAGQSEHLKNAAGTDVTGGMRRKVSQMLALVKEIPDLQVIIFSGAQRDNIAHALLGDTPGTFLHR